MDGDDPAAVQVPARPHALFVHVIVLPYEDGVYPAWHVRVACEPPKVCDTVYMPFTTVGAVAVHCPADVVGGGGGGGENGFAGGGGGDPAPVQIPG